MRIAVTGANGNLGQAITQRLSDSHDVVALVRSERAAATVKTDCDVRIVDYTDPSSLKTAIGQCDAVIHLVGIIKEAGNNTYEQAHESACTALLNADINARRIISLSIVGSDLQSSNRCFQSRARADEILLSADVSATIIRVPMVLGPADYATFALRRSASSKFPLTFRSGSLEQPIFSGDVVNAVMSALSLDARDEVLELAGPNSLTRKALIGEVAKVLGTNPTVISIPISVGMVMAGLLEFVLGNPPVTRAMLGVLDHDDTIDPSAACARLGLKLTPLETFLPLILKAESGQ